MEREIPKEISQKEWEKTGGDLRRAIIEVAQIKGGHDAASHVIELAGDFTKLIPDAQTLVYLNENFPGAAEEFIERAELIQQRRHRHERRSIISRFFRRD